VRQLPLQGQPVKGSGQPQQVRVAGRWQQVASIVDYWRETGRWWAGESSRDFFLVETKGGVFVLSHSPSGWRIEKSVD